MPKFSPLFKTQRIVYYVQDASVIFLYTDTKQSTKKNIPSKTLVKVFQKFNVGYQLQLQQPEPITQLCNFLKVKVHCKLYSKFPLVFCKEDKPSCPQFTVGKISSKSATQGMEITFTDVTQCQMYTELGRIHLPHLWIRKTKCFMDDSSVNFHGVFFFIFFQIIAKMPNGFGK